MKHMFGCKKWLPLVHVHLMQVAAVDSRKSMLFPLESSQISHAYVRNTLWFGRLITSTPCVIPSTPSHWLICSRKRSLARVKTSKSLMMVPHRNSVVFYYKTTLWSCLSWTTCSHVVAEPAHVLELAIVVHFLRISRRHLVDLCCKLSFFLLDSMSLEYPNTNQIWISGRYDGWNISQEL